MRTLVLTIEYDGADFLGWQIQAKGRTVQAVLESSLYQILRDPIRVTAAGRTDAGVHATGQVAHFRTASPMPADRLLRALNGVLPSDVVIHDVREADADFHARFSATGRQYLYRILSRPSALRRRHAWFVPYALNIDAIKKACETLEGVHDFASFCRTASAAEGTQCHIRRLIWQEVDDEWRLDIEANRFMHHMVRTIVGTAVDIGRGRWAPDRMRDMLDARDRRMAGPTAPAHGLYLVRVSYPDP